LPTIPAGGQGRAKGRPSSVTRSLQVDLVILLHSPAFTLGGNARATRGMQKIIVTTLKRFILELLLAASLFCLVGPGSGSLVH